MTQTFGRTIAVLACTIVMSATCVLGAIAPGSSPAGPVQTATRSIA